LRIKGFQQVQKGQRSSGGVCFCVKVGHFPYPFFYLPTPGIQVDSSLAFGVSEIVFQAINIAVNIRQNDAHGLIGGNF
jgi:hypothetical protein